MEGVVRMGAVTTTNATVYNPCIICPQADRNENVVETQEIAVMKALKPHPTANMRGLDRIIKAIRNRECRYYTSPLTSSRQSGIERPDITPHSSQYQGSHG